MNNNVIIENMQNSNTRSTRAQAMYKRDLFRQVDELEEQVHQLQADRLLLWILAIVLAGMVVYLSITPSYATSAPIFAKSEMTKEQIKQLNIMPTKAEKRNAGK